jgi:small multidrug resistance pump
VAGRPPNQHKLTDDHDPTDEQEVMMGKWLILGLAIVLEVIGTSTLKLTEGFTRLGPSLVVIASYAFSFYLLSITLRYIPVGIAYAIWAGAGVFLVVIIGWLVLGQPLDRPALIGMALIVAGVVVINLFSASLEGV